MLVDLKWRHIGVYDNGNAAQMGSKVERAIADILILCTYMLDSDNPSCAIKYNLNAKLYKTSSSFDSRIWQAVRWKAKNKEDASL